MANDIRQIKNKIREASKKIRRDMLKAQKDEMDNKILNRLVKMEEYKNAETVITFVSTDIEVDTRKLIEKAISDDKRVAVPLCIPETRLMEFYYIKGIEDLKEGAFSVLEPIKEKCELLGEVKRSICIVPGLCFDEKGYRLGYGKGYYDRFLSKYGDITVGVCYNTCVKKMLPHGRFDKTVDILITDMYYIRFKT